MSLSGSSLHVLASLKNSMNQEEFECYFTKYREHLFGEVHRFRDLVAVYRELNERKVDSLAALNQAPAFFSVVQDALFTSIVLWASKLFDERGERGIFNFLKLVEHNRKWLQPCELQRRKGYPDGHWMLQNRQPITALSIELNREKIRSLVAISSFKIRRDKFHGHFDKDYFFDRKRLESDAPIRWNDLDEVGKVMGNILNDYSSDYDGHMHFWEAININDLGSLLRNASRGSETKR